jgi:putative membrane protein
MTLVAAIAASGCDDLEVEPSAPADAGDAGTAVDTGAGVDDATTTTADAGPPADASNGDAVVAESRDPQIAQVMTIANQTEVTQGQIAALTAVTPQVQTFASSMVSEHGALLERQQALFRTLGITPVDTSTSRGLQSESDALVDQLRSLRGINVDQVYMDAQVSQHAEVIDLIDSQLLPAVTAPELRAELVSMRATMSAHLDAARSLAILH